MLHELNRYSPNHLWFFQNITRQLLGLLEGAPICGQGLEPRCQGSGHVMGCLQIDLAKNHDNPRKIPAGRGSTWFNHQMFYDVLWLWARSKKHLKVRGESHHLHRFPPSQMQKGPASAACRHRNQLQGAKMPIKAIQLNLEIPNRYAMDISGWEQSGHIGKICRELKSNPHWRSGKQATSSSLPATVVGMGISPAELEIHPRIRRMDISFSNLTRQRTKFHYR